MQNCGDVFQMLLTFSSRVFADEINFQFYEWLIAYGHDHKHQKVFIVNRSIASVIMLQVVSNVYRTSATHPFSFKYAIHSSCAGVGLFGFIFSSIASSSEGKVRSKNPASLPR